MVLEMINNVQSMYVVEVPYVWSLLTIIVCLRLLIDLVLTQYLIVIVDNIVLEIIFFLQICLAHCLMGDDRAGLY